MVLDHSVLRMDHFDFWTPLHPIFVTVCAKVRSRIKNWLVRRRKLFTSRGYRGIFYINFVGSALNIFNLYIWFGELAFDHLFNSCAIWFRFIKFGISMLFSVVKTIVVLVLFSTYNHNSHSSGGCAITP